MNNYLIFTDSACDLGSEFLDKYNVKFPCLTFKFRDEDIEYNDSAVDPKIFYNKMRNGGVASTSAVNMENFKDMFREALKDGHDILYIGFSSGLSTTYNVGKLAAEELREEFPARKILTVDTLSASAGFGLLLYLTIKQKEAGATIEEAAKFVEETKLHLCHWFTVDDLVYLKRGGRISPAVALVGSILGIKPVLHMDNEGHLINMFKVRGRQASIKALADKFGELSLDNTKGPVFISHGDCKEDADSLAQIIKKEYGVKTDLIVNVGSVIGAHSGPGTLALFFVGKER